MKEVWREIEGHPKYMVSNMGRVKCLNWHRTGKERICKLSVNSRGYLVVGIDGVIKTVHRLVAEAFLPNPEKKPCIDHIRTVRTENFVIFDDEGTIIDSSIKWVTYKENNNNPLTKKHLSENAAKTMLGKFGAEHCRSIPIVQLSKDGQFIKKWGAAMEAQRELGIYSKNICNCCKGKQKTAGGFRWVYATDYRKTISEIKPLF